MSVGNEEEVRNMSEKLGAHVFKEIKGIEIESPLCLNYTKIHGLKQSDRREIFFDVIS